jgi:hypothetical protein
MLGAGVAEEVDAYDGKISRIVLRKSCKVRILAASSQHGKSKPNRRVYV